VPARPQGCEAAAHATAASASAIWRSSPDESLRPPRPGPGRPRFGRARSRPAVPAEACRRRPGDRIGRGAAGQSGAPGLASRRSRSGGCCGARAPSPVHRGTQICSIWVRSASGAGPDPVRGLPRRRRGRLRPRRMQRRGAVGARVHVEQKAGSDLGPANEQDRSYAVEGGSSVGAGRDGTSDIQCQRGQAAATEQDPRGS
jgi:hypothetical protein